jgi:hypothetical protein
MEAAGIGNRRIFAWRMHIEALPIDCAAMKVTLLGASRSLAGSAPGRRLLRVSVRPPAVRSSGWQHVARIARCAPGALRPPCRSLPLHVGSPSSGSLHAHPSRADVLAILHRLFTSTPSAHQLRTTLLLANGTAPSALASPSILEDPPCPSNSPPPAPQRTTSLCHTSPTTQSLPFHSRCEWVVGEGGSLRIG